MEKLGDAEGLIFQEVTRSLLAGDTLGFVAMMERSVPLTTLESEWWMRNFRHRLFIFVGALQSKEEKQEYVDRNIVWTTNRVVKFARDNVHEVDSESARFLNEIFVPFLLESIGLEMDFTAPVDSWIDRMMSDE